MLPATRVLALVAAFVFLALINARHNPRTLTRRLSPFSRKFNGSKEDYQMIPLKSQGTTSETYTIVGGFEGRPAILKIIPKVKVSGFDTDKEKEYLERAGMLLFEEKQGGDDGIHYLVMPDVRSDFPNKGDPPLKTFPEWMAVHPEWDTVAKLKVFKAKLRERLIKYSTEIRLLYLDIRLSNFFVDEKLETVVAIDWGPTRKSTNGQLVVGVYEISKDEMDKEEGKKKQANYIELMDQQLESEISLFNVNKEKPKEAPKEGEGEDKEEDKDKDEKEKKEKKDETEEEDDE